MLVKLHKNGGNVVPDGRNVSKWNLSATTMGTLVYTHDSKGHIANFFRGYGGQNFTIYDQAPGAQNNSNRFLVAFGSYEGKSEQFRAMNYWHQKHAEQASAGETGNAFVDAVWGGMSAVANYPESIGKMLALGLQGHKRENKKYFVALMNESKNLYNGHVMHMQKRIIEVYMNGPATLAQIFHKHRGMFFDKV